MQAVDFQFFEPACKNGRVGSPTWVGRRRRRRRRRRCRRFVPDVGVVIGMTVVVG